MTMHVRIVACLTLAVASLVACGGDGYGPTTPDSGGGGDNLGGGGPVGSVAIGSGIQFVSRHNGTANPAVDTVPVGSAVTWTWTGGLPHGVHSVGSESFASSDIRTGSGTYSVTFTAPGTYRYSCAVHGQAMTGTIVVTADPDMSATVSDPPGDTFGAPGVQWDLTALTIARGADGITATLDFSQDVVSPVSGDALATIGFIDLDLDQDPATGGAAVADEFRRDGGSTGLGVDARVNLSDYAADGTVALTDALGNQTGRVRPTFDGHRITIVIPKALLANDDGYLNAAAVAGVVGRATDMIPDRGHLTLARAN
jgi:plastocyanin